VTLHITVTNFVISIHNILDYRVCWLKLISAAALNDTETF
jgi:hypothetical protein